MLWKRIKIFLWLLLRDYLSIIDIYKNLMKNDIDRISSKELGEKIGFTASQIRQDLNCFGDFGQQGYGYNVKDLYNQISLILGLNKDYKTAIVGAGNIGQAIANYSRFGELGLFK